jgi:hypothetical protein
MSYLGSPRLHFFGQFIAEPSTINNLESNFEPPTGRTLWNPNGNHQFAFTGTTVTSLLADGTLSTSGDPLIDTAVGTPASPFAKIVDLDVEVQVASKVYGLQVALNDGAESSVSGTMTSVSFRDFSAPRLLGIYQSTLGSLHWRVANGSWLAGLKAASPTVLSIRFIVDLYTGLSGGPHRGRLAGAIGPARVGEPTTYVAGRRIVGVNGGASALAVLDETTLTVDVGNIVPSGAGGAFTLPSLTIAVRTAAAAADDLAIKSGARTVAATAATLPGGWRELGVVPTTLDRYMLTSGIESLTVSSEDAALCAYAPLGLFSPSGATVAVEDDEGLFVFPSMSAFPMNPGDQASIVLTACTFGRPAATLTLDIEPANSNAPGLAFPPSVTTDASGLATVSFQASDPGTPREGVDGQVFGIGGDWATRSSILIPDAQAAVAIRVFSGVTPPASTTWADVLPIFSQFHRMYPAMAAILDLTDLDSVRAGKAAIRSRLLLPMEDPGHMPVTRDLSKAKRDMVVTWIDAGCPA